MSWDDEDAVFKVVVNHEQQYSIWPDYREIPKGWSAVGKSGSKRECLAYIDQVWTDMRPLSLRKYMDEAQRGHERDTGAQSASSVSSVSSASSGAAE